MIPNITLVQVPHDMSEEDDDEIGELLNNLNISVGGRGDGRHRRKYTSDDTSEIHSEVEVDCYGYSRIQLFVTSILAVIFISVAVDLYTRILDLFDSDAVII